MFLQVGLLGHILTLELTLAPEETTETEPAEIGGGSGGLYERCLEPNVEYVEGTPWEEYEDRNKFGFR